MPDDSRASQQTGRLLLVDDEPDSLELLEAMLAPSGYELVCATDGLAALARLRQEPGRFDAALVDRMMPRMSGMELLKAVKADEQLRDLPVILQTAATQAEQVMEGLEAGAQYYLCKPFDRRMLLPVVRAAVDESRRLREIQQRLRDSDWLSAQLIRGEFQLRTLAEARRFAAALAVQFPDPARVVLGLTELLVNAVEHGSAGITYQEKSQLLALGTWEEEVARRLDAPSAIGKRVRVEYERWAEGIVVTISDDGPGFDWNQYLKISPERAFDAHGRGVALACTISFDEVTYLGRGNVVRVLARKP